MSLVGVRLNDPVAVVAFAATVMLNAGTAEDAVAVTVTDVAPASSLTLDGFNDNMTEDAVRPSAAVRPGKASMTVVTNSCSRDRPHPPVYPRLVATRRVVRVS